MRRDPLTLVRRLRGVRWDWREEAPAEAKAQAPMGVIAQEVEAVLPELVATRDGIKRVRYTGLVSLLMAAMGELDQRIAALDSRSRRDEMASDPRVADGGAAERLGKGIEGTGGTDLDPETVARVFPELVHVNDRGQRVIAYEGLIGQLIEAVKELDRRLAALEAGAEGSEARGG